MNKIPAMVHYEPGDGSPPHIPPEEVIEYCRMPSGDWVVRVPGGESLWFDADGLHPKSRLEFRECADDAGATAPDPVHVWFGLSYSNYLVIPRSVLQSMPQQWQARFVALLEQIPEVLDVETAPSDYWVRAREGGRFVTDPFRGYERGRRLLDERTALLGGRAREVDALRDELDKAHRTIERLRGPKWLRVSCPSCCVRKGEPCITRSGKFLGMCADKPHAARKRDAEGKDGNG